MINSYEVGAVFRLMDEASPALRAISEKLLSVEKLIGKVQSAMRGLNETKVGSLGAGLTGLTEKLSAIGSKADGSANKIREAFQRIDEASTGAGQKIAGLSNALAGLDEKAVASVNGIAGSLGRADTAIGATTTAVRDLAAELRAAGGAAREIPRIPGLGGGGRGGGNHTRPGQGGSGPHRDREGAGVDMGFLGFVGFEAAKAATEALLHSGGEIAHVQEQMTQAGMPITDIAKATAAARVEADKYGLTMTRVMEDIKELRFPFRGTEHAIQFIDPLEKMRVVLNSVSEGKGNSAAGAVYEMARAGELKGLNNAQDYIQYFQGMTQAISATGGKVGPREFMQATQYGKVASFGWDEEFYTKYLPTLMQTMKPSTAGQSLMSLFNTLESGSVTKRSLGQMWDLGLIGDATKIEYNKAGDPVGMRPGAIKGYEELAQNPLKWAEQVLTPLLEKQFGNLGDAANKERAITGLGGLFGNRNTAAAIAELALRSKSFESDAGLIGQAHGLEGAGNLMSHDPTAAMNRFGASWTNLIASLGQPAVQSAIDIMNTMSRGMNALGGVLAAHPEIGKDLVGITGGLAVGLGALAIVGFAAFLPGGVAVVAMATLGGAITGLAAVHWDSLGLSWSQGIANLSKIFADWTAQSAKWDRVIADISSLGGRISDAVSSIFTGIMDKLRAIPGVGRLFPEHAAVLGLPVPPHSLTPLRPGANDNHPGVLNFDGNALHRNDEAPARALQKFGELGDTSGVLKASFTTLDAGTGALNTRFTDLDTGSGGLRAALDILAQTAMGAARALASVALGGGVAGGSGFMTASFGGGGGFGGSYAGGGALPGASATGEHADFIRATAARLGIDPRVAVAVAKSEGLGASWAGGDHGTSFGDFQMHFGGSGIRGMNSGGLGDIFNRQTGLDARDPKNWRAVDEWALKWASKHGWGDWHGAAHIGVGRQQGIGTYHGPIPTVSGPPPRKVEPGVSAGGRVEAMNETRPHEHHIYLDGAKIAKVVTKHQAVAARFPTSMGGPNARTHYTSPGTPVTDAA